MTDNTLFVGMDVHKKTISVAVVEATAGAEVQFYGTILNTPDSVRSLYKKLTKKDGRDLHICYPRCGLEQAYGQRTSARQRKPRDEPW
jgi:hypothetical protein